MLSSYSSFYLFDSFQRQVACRCSGLRSSSYLLIPFYRYSARLSGHPGFRCARTSSQSGSWYSPRHTQELTANFHWSFPCYQALTMFIQRYFPSVHLKTARCHSPLDQVHQFAATAPLSESVHSTNPSNASNCCCTIKGAP